MDSSQLKRRLDYLKENVSLGDSISIILFKGAEYDNGYTPAPTIDPRGYRVSDLMTHEPGNGLIGRLASVDEKHNRIFLSSGWKRAENEPDFEIAGWFVEVGAIHSGWYIGGDKPRPLFDGEPILV